MRRALVAVSVSVLVGGTLAIAAATPAFASITSPPAGNISGTQTFSASGTGSALHCAFVGDTSSTTIQLVNSSGQVIDSASSSEGYGNDGAPSASFTYETEHSPNGSYKVNDSEHYYASSGFLGLGCSSQTNNYSETVVIDNLSKISYEGATSGEPGESVTVAAQLGENGGNNVTPPAGQTITWTLSGQSGSVSATTNGSGFASTTLLVTGTPRNATITASYGSQYYAASSSSSPFTVNPDPTTTSVSSSSDPSVYGQPVTFTAKVAVGSGISGVTFDDGGSVQFAVNGTDVGGAQTLSSSGQASFTDGALAASSTPYSVTATYSGDGNFAGSSGSLTGGQTVNPAATQITLSATPVSPSVYGESVYFTAVVTTQDPGNGNPAGTVAFTETPSGGSAQPIGGAVSLTPVAGSTRQSSASSIPISILTPGSYTITATYNPSSNFSASANSLTYMVNQAGTSIAVTSTANPSVYGQPVQWTATVSPLPPGTGTPQGTVTFTSPDDGFTDTETLSNGSATSAADAGLAPGDHTIDVSFTDTDGNYQDSSTTFTQKVNQDPTTTTVSSGPNPSVYGEPITFSATVTANAPGSGTPTGTVTFEINGTPYETVTLVGGSATANPISSLSPGLYTITALYTGDTDFQASSGSTQQTVNKDPTTTVVASSANPSVYGQTVLFSATVTANPPGAGTPTGTVTFSDGTTVLGTASLSVGPGGDQASITTSSLSVGDHAISAVYSGDSDFLASTGTLSQTVNPDPTTTTLAPTGAVVQGQPVAFSATVTANPPGAGAPTGTVQFDVNGAPLGSPVPLTPSTSGSTATSESISTLTPGNYTVTATYSGNTDFLPSSGQIGQAVNEAATTTSLTVAPDPSTFGQPVTLSVTVSPQAPGAGTPTGTVDLYDGPHLIGSSQLSGGQATFTTSTLAIGDHQLSAEYLGEYDFLPSTSSTVEQTVGLDPTTTGLASSVDPSSYTQPVTLTATVTPVNQVTLAPTGSVEFYDGTTSLGTATVSAAGNGAQATLTISSLPVGSDSLSAVYSGDGTFASSTSATLSQTVKQASTTLVAQKATVEGEVSATLSTAWAPVAGQTLVFTTGSTPICSAVTNANGTASCSGTAQLPEMLLNNGYTVTYAGDSDYGPSSAHAGIA